MQLAQYSNRKQAWAFEKDCCGNKTKDPDKYCPGHIVFSKKRALELL
jgi:hypothetical protein